MSNLKLHENSIFASVPLVLTFVNEPAATGYECQNRDTRTYLDMYAKRPPMNKPGPISRKAVIRPAARRLFRRLCQAGLCRPRTRHALGRDYRSRAVGPLRTPEDTVAETGGRPDHGTGDAGAAGGGPDGARNPARFRRDPSAHQSLLRLERGRPAGAAARAAVAPVTAAPLARTGRHARSSRSRRPCPRSKMKNYGRRWRGSGPQSSEIEPSVPVPTFASRLGGHICECQDQRDTGKYRILVRF